MGFWFYVVPFSELAVRAASLRRNLTDRSCGKRRKLEQSWNIVRRNAICG
jgi:hypothetical protein